MRTDMRQSISSTQGRRRALISTLSAHLPMPISQGHARRALPWRALLLSAGGVWLATRLAYLALTLLFPVVNGGGVTSGSISTTPISLPLLIERWMNWDGGAFIRIAEQGYEWPKLTAYFPLYPGVIRLFAIVIGPHWAIAALLASNAGALLAFIGVAVLTAQISPSGDEVKAARIAMALFAAYPLAFFLVAAYSDGLFVGLAALTLLFGMRRHWGWAALCGLLAALCRPVAPALILPLAWELIQGFRERRSAASTHAALRELGPALAAVVAPLLGLALYCMWLWLRFGDPLIFIKVESGWAHVSMTPLLSIPVAILAFAHAPVGSPLQLRLLLDLAPVLGGIIATLLAARRAPLAFTFYMLSLLYMLTSAPLNYIDLFVSGGRYMLAAVPLFALAGVWMRRFEWAIQACFWSGAMLQAALAIFFLAHGWIV